MQRSPSPLTGAVAASRLSVAVLPIATIGGTPEDEYFGEGLTEELTLALSRLEGLRVCLATSAASFRGQSLSLSRDRRAARRRVRHRGERASRRRSASFLGEADSCVRGFAALVRDVRSHGRRRVRRAGRDHEPGGGHDRRRVAAGEAARPGAGGGDEQSQAYDLYLLGRHHWSERSEDGHASRP